MTTEAVHVEGQADEKEIIQFTDKYHSYRVAHGPQYNAGETARVPKAEADLLVAEGAAVRISDVSEHAEGGAKAMSHPIKDKMVKQTATK